MSALSATMQCEKGAKQQSQCWAQLSGLHCRRHYHCSGRKRPPKAYAFSIFSCCTFAEESFAVIPLLCIGKRHTHLRSTVCRGAKCLGCGEEERMEHYTEALQLATVCFDSMQRDREQVSLSEISPRRALVSTKVLCSAVA